MTSYRCTNLGGCSVADGFEKFEIALGEDEVCSECGKPAENISREDPGPRWKLIAACVGALVVLGGGGFGAYQYLMQPSGPSCSQEGYTKTSAGGNAEAMYALGEACLSKAVKAGDKEGMAQAAILFRRASDLKHPIAAYQLGRLYDPKDLEPGRSGQLVADPAISADWYLRAAEYGSLEAKNAVKGLVPAIEERAKRGDRVAEQLLKRML